MLYDQFFIDDLKERADLVRVIEPYAPLKKKGTNWMGNCPFHQEKTPSFSVNPAKGFYKCFGCGKGGNVYTFLMEMEGLTFPEAIERVAGIAGVALPEPIDDGQYRQNKKRKEEKKQLADQVIDLNRLALEFWENELFSDSPKAAAARSYLEQRGITDEMIKQFHIGFAPDSWNALLDHLIASGADEHFIELSGLVSVNEDKQRTYDRFRNRVIFPVLDADGRPVAFGARAMGDDQPKYLNSPETPAYVKGRHLYGLSWAKDAIRRKKFAILVEGYLDLIALVQFGITNVVAGLGTAFTEDQARLLSRFTKKVVVNYDGDSAGIKAARRVIEELLPKDIEIKVLTLPDGQDPDDFIRRNGVEAYTAARGRASAALDFLLDSSMNGRSLLNPRDKADAIGEILPVIGLITNNIQRRESFDQAMDHFRIEDQSILRDLWRSVRSNQNSGEAPPAKPVNRSVFLKKTVAEHQLLELIIHDAELREKILQVLEPTDYEMLATAPLFISLYEHQRTGTEPTVASLLSMAGDDDFFQDLIPILMMAEPKRARGEVIDEVFHEAENCVLSLRSMAIQNRIHEVSRELIDAEHNSDLARLDRLVNEHMELSRLHRSILSKTSET